MYLIGVVAMGLFGFLYFGMVDTAIPSAVFIAIVMSLIPHDMQYGPQAALIAESFTPRLRYSGASLGYQLASIIAGGPAPLIATCAVRHLSHRLRHRDLYCGCAVISVVAAAFMPDYTGKDISAEYDEWALLKIGVKEFAHHILLGHGGDHVQGCNQARSIERRMRLDRNATLPAERDRFADFGDATHFVDVGLHHVDCASIEHLPEIVDIAEILASRRRDAAFSADARKPGMIIGRI
jgi:hypothetical protein